LLIFSFATQTDYPDQNLHDYEWNECWVVRDYIGCFTVDSVEVSEAKFVPFKEVQAMVLANASKTGKGNIKLTPWFLEEWQHVQQLL